MKALLYALQIARVLGAIFLVIQIILILDFIFIINEYLIDKEACHFVLISGSALLYLGSLAFNGLAYYYYAPTGACRLNIFFITWTLIMGIFITVLSVGQPQWVILAQSCCAMSMHPQDY